MNTALWVARKEIREMWRDKRVRSGALIMPMVLVFLIMSLIGTTINAVTKKGVMKIYVVNSNHPVARQLLSSDTAIKPVASIEEGKKLILSGKAELVLAFPTTDGQHVDIEAYFDNKEEKSTIAVRAMGNAIEKVSKDRLKQILQGAGISEEMADPVRMVEKPIQVGADKGAAEFLVSMLPYLIVIWTFYGGMGIVGDLFAGEKEKLTLETLLISPASRRDIAIGKFLALTAVCFVSAASALLGMLIIGSSGLPMVAVLFKDGMGITPMAVVSILVVLVPTAALMSGTMLAVSAFAKNLREAQTHLAILSFIILLPAMVGQVIGVLGLAKSQAIYYIPVLNTSAVIRAALQGKLTVMPVVITTLTCVVLASLALILVVKLVKREQILVRI